MAFLGLAGGVAKAIIEVIGIITERQDMFLQSPAETPATSRLFQSDLDERGYVMNLSRLWAWRPEVSEAFSAVRSLLTGKSSLSQRELGVIVCATASSLGDSYCALAWGKVFATSSDPLIAAAVLRARDDGELTVREQALAGWVRKVARNANATTAGDVEALRTAGFTDKEIFEATTFIGFRIAFSTVNDALGARPDRQLAAEAPPEVRAAVTYGRPVAESTD